MMRGSARAAIVAGMMFGLWGVPAAANSTPMRYDCDTTAGAYSEIVQQQDGPNYTLQTEITAKRFSQHHDWRPGARIQIKSADGKKSIWIQLVAGAARPQALAVSLFTNNGGEEKQYMVTTVKLGEPVRASIRIKEGVVQAEVAGQVAEVPVQIGPGAEVSVGCSTGQFIFEKLSLGTAS